MRSWYTKSLVLVLAVAPVVGRASSPPPAEKRPLVLLETTAGKIVLELNGVRAPYTVENFITYVKEGFYDGTIFHRVIKSFLIQGGAYNAAWRAKATRSPIESEADNGLSNVRGTVTAARTLDPDSARSQFFINLVDNSHVLDVTEERTGYTVFGTVLDGMDTVDRIANGKVRFDGRVDRNTPAAPVEPVVITRAQVLDKRAYQQPAGGPFPDVGPLTAVVATAKGVFRIRLYADQTPLAVANFANLARRGLYHGLTFYRIIGQTLIEGGDPTGTGKGGPGYSFVDEIDPARSHDAAGKVSMSNDGPDTNGSRFLITLVAATWLDKRFTNFGEVTDGMDVVRQLAAGDTITSITIEGDPQPLLDAYADLLRQWNDVLDRTAPTQSAESLPVAPDTEANADADSTSDNGETAKP